MSKVCNRLGYSYKTTFNNTLTVEGHYTKNHKSRFVLSCSVCSMDEELFPKGEIETSSESLNSKRCVCACNPKYKYSERQNTIRVDRRCKELNYDFLGYVGKYQGVSTKLSLYNPTTDNHWKTSSIQTFLLVKVKDPKEHFIKLADSQKLSDNEYVDDFYKTGNFKKGTYFKRVSASYWKYFCPVCSKDEYSTSGLCDGWFKVAGSKLKKGRLSCRCSKFYRWNSSQREYQISKIMNPLGWMFKGWVDGYKNPNSNFKWLCDKGHSNITSLHNFTKRVSCKSCSGNGFNNNLYSQLYIVQWHNSELDKSFIKYGITNKTVTSRILNQKMKTKFTPKVLYSFQGVGDEVFSCEKEIKNHLGGYYIDKNSFPRGFSETLEYSDEVIGKLLGIVSIFNLEQNQN